MGRTPEERLFNRLEFPDRKEAFDDSAEMDQGNGEAWGRDVRRIAETGLQGTLGRISDEGPTGAAIRKFGWNLPPGVDFSDIETLVFHRAWLDMNIEERAILWTRFVVDTTRPYEVLDMSKSRYYRIYNLTMVKMACNFHLYRENSPKSPPW